MNRKLWLSIAALAVGASLLVAGAVTSAASGSSTKVGKTGGVLRTDVSGTDFDYLDPALAYSQWTWQFTYLTNYKLLNFPDKPAPDGGKLVPEGAAALPVISKDGKTYTFTIKSGAKFNTGEPVTAQSFADAINRDLNPGMQSPAVPFIADIVGAQAVVDGKAATASGVKVAGNKLIITLAQPGADFLARMTLPFFSAVPKNMPLDSRGVDAPASAGPYYVKSWTKNRTAVFLKNPNYKGSRPANPDQIVVTLNTDPNQSFLKVKSGETDFDAGGLPPEQIASLAPLLGKQFFTNPTAETDYLALNTSPGSLFADLGARKAMNWAIDRPAMLRARGAFAGQRDDQILAPGIGGYRNVTVYPLKGANPVKAKTFYSKGGNATVYTGNRGAALIQGQVIQYNMQQIGINADIKQYTSAVLYAKAGTKGEPFDAALAGWGWDYPDPFDFIDVLLNGNNIHDTQNNNLSYFNVAAVNKQMDAAAKLVGDDRYKAYGNLDALITVKYAPWAAFLHRNQNTFLSSRMDPKCFLFQPIYARIDLGAECFK
jgi:peptide/nickel transport system substrate-binding protein